jgi:hypothetical protein
MLWRLTIFAQLHNTVTGYPKTCDPIQVKFSLEQATKAQRGIRGIALLLLLLLLLLEALQLQRSFVLLNEFFPFGSVSDAVLPVSYSHVYYITFYIILPPVFGSSL